MITDGRLITDDRLITDGRLIAFGICPSPSGEVRWGLIAFSWSNQFLPLGKVRMGLRQVIAMKSEQEFFVFGATAGEAIFLRLLLGK